MAFGRLDVFWPDGRFESYMLEQSRVSVGRADANVIVLPTDNISRYHFSLIYQDGVVSITDLESENGTYVDGMPLTPNQPYPLGDVEEIQVGQLRLIFRMVDESSTMPMVRLEEDTHRTVQREDRFRVEVDTNQLDVWPAASSSAEFSITNTSDEKLSISVHIAGMPDGWMRINRPRLDIDAGDTQYVLLNIKPPRRPDVRPSAHAATVTFTRSDGKSAGLTINLDVRVHGFNGFGMALTPARIDGERPARLYLHNQGSAPLTLTLQGRTVDSGTPLDIDLGVRTITLDAGARKQVACKVEPRQRPLAGNPEERLFDIIAHSENAAGFSAATRGRLLVTPVMPLWGAITAAGLAISLILIAAVGLLGLLTPAPQPVVSNVRLDAETVARGTLLGVTWDAEDTEAIRISANQILLAELAGDAREAQVDTSQLDGGVTIVVEGLNGERISEAGARILVYEPLTLLRFEVQPAQVVRAVLTTMNIEWQITGAVRTRIEGLDAFSSAPLANYGASGRLEGVAGVAYEPFELVLVGEDAIGGTLRETRRIPVIDATCTAREAINLREGPGELYQPVSAVTAGTTLVVDGRAAEADWLRVRLPGGVNAWGQRDLLECATFFAPENLVTILDVPPPPTPAPTLVPTATPEAAQPVATATP